MIDFSNFDSLLAMTMYFNNEKICKDVIAEVRWGKGEKEPMSYVHAFVVEKTDRNTLQSTIGQFVAEGSTVMTYELNAYRGLENLGYDHAIVCHGAQEFVNGDIFTNGIEGFWGHFRRMITGCYHNVTDEHLQAHIDEACFRWNTRKASQEEHFLDMFFMSIGLVRPNREFVLCKNVG